MIKLGDPPLPDLPPPCEALEQPGNANEAAPKLTALRKLRRFIILILISFPKKNESSNQIEGRNILALSALYLASSPYDFLSLGTLFDFLPRGHHLADAVHIQSAGEQSLKPP